VIDSTENKKWFFHPQVVFPEGAVVVKATFNDDGSEKAYTVVKDVMGGVRVTDNDQAPLDFEVQVAEKTIVHI